MCGVYAGVHQILGLPPLLCMCNCGNTSPRQESAPRPSRQSQMKGPTVPADDDSLCGHFSTFELRSCALVHI